MHDNKIAMHSASDEMYAFVHQKYGGENESAADLFLDATASDPNRRWVWKYHAFCSILAKYKSKRKQDPRQIISFGDGRDEARALSKYAKVHGVKCAHIDFITTPTINQIREQWNYIIDQVDELIVNKITNPYTLYSMNLLFKCDNNKHGTGDSEQLKAIAGYIQLWISLVPMYHIHVLCMISSNF